MWSLSQPDDLAILTRTMDIAGCHPGDLLYYPISSRWHPDLLNPKSSGWVSSLPYLIRMAYGRCTMSSGWLSCISTGWVTANPLCHPDDIPFHPMSTRWLIWGWYLIRMSYSNVIMSYRWDTLPFLSHQDEIATFDFSQHAVALQRFRRFDAWPPHFL